MEENFTYKLAGYEIGQDPNEEEYVPLVSKHFDSEPKVIHGMLHENGFRSDLNLYIHVYDEEKNHVGFLNKELKIESEGIPWRIDTQLEYVLLNFLGEEE